MGLNYVDRWVLLDEGQLQQPLAQDMNDLLKQVYCFMESEISGFDDTDISMIEITGIVSERLDTSQEFDGYKGSVIVETGQSWDQFVKRIMNDLFALPDKHVDRYLRTGSTGKLRKWLQKRLKSGRSYREGNDEKHKTALDTLSEDFNSTDKAAIPGFSDWNIYYDSYGGEYCDARQGDVWPIRRLIVELKLIIGD